MDNIINYWKNLPEWARWILCWPLIVLGSIAANLIFLAVYSTSAWTEGFGAAEDHYKPESFGQFIMAGIQTVVQVSSLFILCYYLLPRGKDIVTAIIAFVMALFTVMGLFGHYMDFSHDNITILQYIAGSLLMLLFAGTGIFWAYKTRVAIKSDRDLLDSI